MNAVSQLDREWSSIARQDVSAALAGWRVHEPLLRRFASPLKLVQFLSLAREGESDEQLLALLSIARTDSLAGRIVLQAILPALKAQSVRIVHPREELDELWELLFFYAWQSICCYPLATRRRSVAANLVLQVLHDTTRELHRDDRPDEAVASPSGCALAAAVASIGTTGSLGAGQAEALVLAAASAGVISGRDAELVLHTRLEGIRIALVAQVLGANPKALYKRRDRAEQRLRELLTEFPNVEKTAVSDLISDVGAKPLPAEAAPGHPPLRARPAA